MKLRYIIPLCGVSLLIGCAACWFYVKQHTVRFGPFDRSMYEGMCIDWAPYLLLSVRIEGSNRICWATGRATTKTQKCDAVIPELAAIDNKQLVSVAVDSNWTVAQIDDLVTFTTNCGIANLKVMVGRDPTTTNSNESIVLREIRISQPRTIYDHLYEWYLESERDRVQQGGRTLRR